MEKPLVVYEPSDEGWVVYCEDEPEAAVVASTPAEARVRLLETMEAVAQDQNKRRFGFSWGKSASASTQSKQPFLFLLFSWVFGCLAFLGMSMLLIHYGRLYLHLFH